MNVTESSVTKQGAKWVLGVLGVVVMAPTVWADAAQQLTQRLEPLQSYNARFDQQIFDGSGERLQQAHGEMWLSRPGLLRWEVEAPYTQTVVSDGEDVYLYDPDLEQVTVQEVDNRVTHTPALLLSGSVDELTQNYEVMHKQEDGKDVFMLVPISADTLFEELHLSFDDETLTRLLMTDSTGQRTAIHFSDISLNQWIDERQFVFDIPDNVDVIRDTH
ncbi:outer membrane lipoprotein chaperone LolA [Halomonas sp. Bachu 37]|uniref:outer membrane lipoprotein chaperone LolA n=1 Tax=Halomonas kashgarensis TaxID=3084920 RepID=UPI003216BE43